MTGPAGTSGRSESLIGRDADLSVLHAFLGEAAQHEGALLVTGEPGIGKSTTLDAAARTASEAGLRVIRAAGGQLPASTSFAGLDHVLASRHADVRHLGPVARQALGAALGMVEGTIPDVLRLADATIELLSLPPSAVTLVVIDDLQWLDPASAEVLAVVARRLAGTAVRFLGAASGSTLPAVFATAGLAEHRLQPLEEAPAASLVRARHPAVAEMTLRRVLAEAQGNPLALIELPARLTSDQLAACAPLPHVLQVTPRLAASFSSQLGDLPRPSREALLLAALDGSGELRRLSLASEGIGGLDQLAPAEEAGLVVVDARTRTLEFHHPVVRAIVVGRSTDIERRRAHRALAKVTVDEPERRTWHLAEACALADEEVAGMLEEVGRANVARGDGLGAAAALIRAAELSEVPSRRGRRLVEAAYVSAVITGHLPSAARLLDAARETGAAATGSLRAATTAAELLFDSDCDVESARRLLMRALSRYADADESDNDTALDALYSLFMICFHASRPEVWDAFDDLLGRLTRKPAALVALSARVSGATVCDSSSRPVDLDTTAVTGRGDVDPVTVCRAAVASLHLDRVGALRPALRQVLRRGRDAGAVALTISAIVSSCTDDWLTGQWDEAIELADEGIDLGRRHGYHRHTEFLSGYVRPLVLVCRGQPGALADTEQMASWARRHDIGLATTSAHHVRTLSAMATGDFEAAYQLATAMSPAGTLAWHTPHCLWTMVDVVESAVRTGRTLEASAHVDAMRAADVAAMSPRLALVVAGASAIAADGSEATRLYEASLAVAGGDRWPFDLARITLCFGEHLRRQHDLVESRVHLRAAADLFERLRAVPWALRAENELRATGVSRTANKRRVVTALTPEELRIADLAATGLSNKQIAERVHLSHRTVGARLHKVFPKLGITTRAGLRDALDALQAPST